ncbi:hypothetical protein CR513_14916, partial [Mucuna pruriens]
MTPTPNAIFMVGSSNTLQKNVGVSSISAGKRNLKKPNRGRQEEEKKKKAGSLWTHPVKWRKVPTGGGKTGPSPPKLTSLIIQVLTTPTYQNNCVVPWKYNEGEVIHVGQEKVSLAREVTNIIRIGGVTRSGRVYVPEELRKKDLTLEKKGKPVENQKKITMEGEATEFLKLIRHNEYELLD